MMRTVFLRKDYQGGFREHLPYLLSQEFAYPVSIERRIFCTDKRTGKEEVLKFGQDSISHLLPQICQNSNVIRISYFLIYRENTKQNQQFCTIL
jgi:hypothetical protein